MGRRKRPQYPAASVAAVLDAFVSWVFENKARKTYIGYRDFCQSFKDFCGDMPVDELTTDEVTAWLDTKTTWNSTTKHGAITCLIRAFNWARKNKSRLVKVNPIAGMEKPAVRTRTEVVSPAEFQVILRNIPDREFREMLEFSVEVGARPQETKQLEARHVDLDKSRCVIPAAEAKKTKSKRPRVIYLTKKAESILKRLVAQRPSGNLFLNRRGRPWTTSAVKSRFARLEEKLGRRYCQYMFRHTWVTEKLKAGVDSHVVGTLAGHVDTSMIDRVYSHIADDHEFMLAAARKKRY